MTFNIGDRVRVTSRFGPLYGRVGTVVDPAGTRWDRQTSNVFVHLPDHPGPILSGFGDRSVGAFEPSDLEPVNTTQETNDMTLHPIGTRIEVQQYRDDYGREPVNPRFIGATGEVIAHFGSPPISHKVRFDDGCLSSNGSWSFEALRASEVSDDDRDHAETAPDGDARTYDPETGISLPDLDTVQAAGLDGTNRSEGGPYTWKDVALHVLSDRDALASALRQRKVDAEAEAESLRQRLNRANSGLDYAIDLLPDAETRSRVFGYVDGLNAS